MQDNFDLKGYLRHGNKLLNEGIGGYFDLKGINNLSELKDLGNMEEDEDSFVLAQRDSENYNRLIDLGGDQIEKGIISLLEDGFDKDDILDFVKAVLEENFVSGN